jgi:hydrogenase expression/formation protein HypD
MNGSRFSDPTDAKRLVAAITHAASNLGKVRIMEVCGTHTMEIGRQGIRQLLPGNIELISGPGCPVCVTPAPYIDALCDLATEKEVTVATFGDLFRVPGERRSLADVKAQGAAVEVVTSPLAALDLARRDPARKVVMTAVGFETTIPSAAAAVRTAMGERLGNISFLGAHRLVPPALQVLLDDPSIGISAFLLPGHVSAIIGEKAYSPLIARGIPGAIAGFAPLDILGGILALLDMLVRNDPGVVNGYTRVARPQGNEAARALIDKYYKPVDAVWRGIGSLPLSGLALRPEFAEYDAAKRYGIVADRPEMPKGCSCGDVLKGRIRPDACPLFGKACNPDHPVGPCMVSSEGSCAAYFKYGR